jgi:predicted metalloprotease with PDZ domain
MHRLVLVPLCALILYAAPATEPIVYTIRFPDPASKSFTVQMNLPTGGCASVDLMVPVWSPGFYGLQSYAGRVTAFTARGADGSATR